MNLIWFYGPCGECGELVPRDTGCKHWKPGVALAHVQRKARTANARNARNREATKRGKG